MCFTLFLHMITYFLVVSVGHFRLQYWRTWGCAFLSYSSWVDTEDRASPRWHPASGILLPHNPAGDQHPPSPDSQNVCTAASLKKPTLIYELTLKLNPQTHRTHVDQMLADGLCLPFGSLLIFLHPLPSQNEINGVLFYWSDYSDPYLIMHAQTQ